MEEKYLYQLAEFVLPSDVLHYFSIVKIESDTSLLRIYLDEKMEKELSDDLHFESKGFMEAVEVTDFPIRDHKVILVLRRRRWIDIRTGKSFSSLADRYYSLRHSLFQRVRSFFKRNVWRHPQ